MWVAMKFTTYNLGEVFKGTDNRIAKMDISYFKILF